MYKLICLDLDGTLLTSNKTVSDSNRAALIQCLNNGQQVYLVTGRPLCFSYWIAQKIDPRIHIICCNGAWYQCAGQTIQHEISPIAIRSLVNALEQFPTVHAFFKGAHDIYTTSAYDPRFLYEHINSDLPDFQTCHAHSALPLSALLEQAQHILKVLIYEPNPKTLLDFRTHLESLLEIQVTSMCKQGFDIVARGVDKNHAIQTVCTYLNILPEQVLAIGDGDNDLQMLQAAGLGIAMGNAPAEVQALADVIAPTNDEDGVAWALQHYAHCCIESPKQATQSHS